MSPDPSVSTSWDEWADGSEITASNDALLGDLGRTLDVDRGLSDAVLPARHSALIDDLTDILDTDAGLAEILAASASAPSAQPTKPLTARTPPPSHRFRFFLVKQLAFTLNAADPRKRLSLRTDPFLGSLVDALDALISVAMARAIIRSLDSTLTQEPIDLASLGARGRDLGRILGRILDRGSSFNPRVAGEREIAHAFAHIRVLGRDLVQDLGMEPRRDLVRCRDLDLEFSLVLRRISDRATSLGRGLELEMDMEDGLPRTLSLPVGRLWDRELDQDLSALEIARDDFTWADLHDADLTGIDLNGVRWSRAATRWPADWADRIEVISEEVASGIMVVRHQGPLVKFDLVHV